MVGEEGRDAGTKDGAIAGPLLDRSNTGQGAQCLSERGAAHT